MRDKLPVSLVYGTAGNHEAHPANSYRPKSVGRGSEWIYKLLSSEWSRWVGIDAAKEASEMGVYSTLYPGSKLRVISINTNLYYLSNFWIYQDMAQHSGANDAQLSWLVGELDAAERAGERVYIIGHMPLGDESMQLDASNYLDQVVARYSSTIAAMFFGHTHVDTFEISYSDYKARSAEKAVAMSYIGPSLTPMSGMPAFRVYDVDAETFSVMETTTYVANMSEPGFQTTGPVWAKLYSAKEAYGMALRPPLTDARAELTPAFWHRVTEAMETNSSLFAAYFDRKSRGWATGDGCRDESCRRKEICQLRAGRAQDSCRQQSSGLHLRRRDGIAEGGRADECGVPMSFKTLRSLVVG